MQPMIELEQLTKRYPHKAPDGKNTYKTAVDALTLPYRPAAPGR